jgi:hypothetical protein
MRHLWDEYKEVKSAVPLMNVIRRILEYYFLQLCGYEGSTLRKVILVEGKAKGYYKDENGNDNEEKYQLGFRNARLYKRKLYRHERWNGLC